MHAVDRSAPYLAFARARPAGADIQFAQADAASLPFATGAFAAALAQLALNFMPNPGRTAIEMRRVTRSGGVIAAAVWDFRGGLVFQRLFWDTAATLSRNAGRARDRLFSHPLALPEGLVELWRATGLQAVERGSLTIRMEFAGFEDYWQPLLGGEGPFGAFVAGLSERQRTRIRASVRRAFLAGAPDGPRSLTATAWAVRGCVP